MGDDFDFVGLLQVCVRSLHIHIFAASHPFSLKYFTLPFHVSSAQSHLMHVFRSLSAQFGDKHDLTVSLRNGNHTAQLWSKTN
jgi:hypothetical protein